MKLNYWTLPHKTDTTKSLRAKTLTALLVDFAHKTGSGALKESDYGVSYKVSVEYKDGYDLMTQILTGTMVESPAVVPGKTESAATAGATSQTSTSQESAGAAGQSDATKVDAGHPDRKQVAA